MELAKVTSKGQITIPKSVREMLNLKEGSKVLFFKKENDIIIKNAAMLSLEKIQKDFEGESERLGLETEEDVVKMIKKFRKERK
jgi:AbrB family looped-hinge helix DNA binding protein